MIRYIIFSFLFIHIRNIFGKKVFSFQLLFKNGMIAAEYLFFPPLLKLATTSYARDFTKEQTIC